MRVRLARPADLGIVGEITVRAYQEFLLGPDDPYADRLRDAATRARESELWVADDDGDIRGSVTWCPEGSPWRELAGPGEGEFRMLSVAPEAQGRGVGDLLVRHVLDLARTAGHGRVLLSSLPTMAAAHRLYARHGFTRLPDRDWRPIPDVLLLAFVLDLEAR